MRNWWIAAGLILITMVLMQDVALGKWRDTSSEALRQNKTFSFGLGTDGYAAGLYLGDDALLEASIGTRFSEDDDAGEWDPERIRTGLTLKLFRGNSFYSQIGIKHDQFSEEAAQEEPVHQATAYGTFGVGNQWQWDYFTFGVRWLDLYVPVMNQVKVPAEAGADYERRARGPQQFKPQIEWFGLYAGVAF